MENVKQSIKRIQQYKNGNAPIDYIYVLYQMIISYVALVNGGNIVVDDNDDRDNDDNNGSNNGDSNMLRTTRTIITI